MKDEILKYFLEIKSNCKQIIRAMIHFDFKQHFQKLKEAPDKLAESYIERDWSRYYDSLSKEEQQEFKAAFNEYLREKNTQHKEQIALGKEMMLKAGLKIS